jgi:hypothetical protein
VAALLGARAAHASAGVEIDRVAVRFEASELGGAEHPHFVFARVLAFEARIEALAEARRGYASAVQPHDERHVRAALERHVTEQILRKLPIEPPATVDELRLRAISARLVLEQRVGGRTALLEAATAEGMETEDLDALVVRQARASLYLDRMVAPMLDVSDAELRDLLRTEPTPFRGQRFEDVSQQLRRWYLGERLSNALAAFFQGARSRVRIWILDRP